MIVPAAPLPEIADLKHALDAPAVGGEAWSPPTGGWGCRFYRRGSLALAAGVAAVRRAQGVEEITVWVPDYFCDEALAPLRGLAVALRFYPGQPDLTPDWEFLERGVAETAGKQVLMLVHYFGFANVTREAVDFCRRHGLTLLEDAAHVLRLAPGLGMGDLLVFSPRKLLALPAGGVLVFPQKLADGLPDLPAAPVSRDTILWALRRLAQKTLLSLGVSWSWWWRRLPDCEPVFQGPFSPPVLEPCDRYTLGLLALAEPHLTEIAARRRRTYARLADCLKGFSGVRPLFPQLTNDTCPYVFPLVIDQGSDKVMARLRSRGILADRWPTLPPEVQTAPAKHRMALEIRSRLLLLPVHQSLTAPQVDWLASELRRALAEQGRDSRS
jgi:perosamine synthetase